MNQVEKIDNPYVLADFAEETSAFISAEKLFSGNVRLDFPNLTLKLNEDQAQHLLECLEVQVNLTVVMQEKDKEPK